MIYHSRRDLVAKISNDRRLGYESLTYQWRNPKEHSDLKSKLEPKHKHRERGAQERLNVSLRGQMPFYNN